MQQVDAPAPILGIETGNFEIICRQFLDKELSQSLSVAPRIDLFFLARIGGKGSRAELKVRLHSLI